MWFRVVLSAFLFNMASFASELNADVLYDNFGPNDEYITSSGLTIGFKTGFEQGPIFSVDDGDFYLDSVEAAISHLSGENLVTISVYESVGGVPGQILESTTASDVGGLGDNNPPVLFEFSGTTVLQEGADYFLVASSVNDGISWLAWNLNSTADFGAVARELGGEWEFDASANKGAFRVHGTAVPEPASLWMLSFAMLGFSSLRRR